jgi:hypothetical protein
MTTPLQMPASRAARASSMEPASESEIGFSQ